jgi:hypothetical protein
VQNASRLFEAIQFALPSTTFSLAKVALRRFPKPPPTFLGMFLQAGKIS